MPIQGRVGKIERLLYIYRSQRDLTVNLTVKFSSASQASRNQIDAFIAKRGLLIVLCRPWMDWQVGVLCQFV